MSNGDPSTGRSSLVRFLVAVVVASLAVVLFVSGTAEAGLGAAAAPSFPTGVTVGDTGQLASIQLRNNNTAGNVGDTNTVCNFGDLAPCPVGDPGITLIPSCGQLGAFSTCAPVGADPDVFQVSATALGRVGSACAGMPFAVTLIDPAFGQLRFTPQPPGTHVTLPGFDAVCLIDFTFDVLKTATIDQNPGLPGQQTVQVVDNTVYVGQITASGRGTSTGTTVARATPTLATTTAANLALGGTLSDNVVVSGRVNPLPGATVDFRLYGPNDATCSGPPVFESLGVPYPVTGGPVTSAAFTPTVLGVYRWVASYSGDANNNAVTGTCNDANEVATVTPAVPSIATVASANIILGSGQLTDSATVFGRINPLPGATIDFRLYGPNDATCTGTPAFTTIGVPYPVAGGAVTSGVFTPTFPGDYRWVASYSGDANNSAVSGTCNAANETTTVSPTPTPTVVISEAPPLPATGSGTTALLYVAFGVTITGCVLVGSTSRRRRHV